MSKENQEWTEALSTRQQDLPCFSGDFSSTGFYFILNQRRKSYVNLLTHIFKRICETRYIRSHSCSTPVGFLTNRPRP
jgi:hypothetical protein